MRPIACLLALLLSVALLTACGGGEGSTSSTTTGAQPQPVPSQPADPPAAGFQDDSGQTEIPAFGSEAGAGQRSQAQEALSAYLQAADQGEWERACAELARANHAQLRQLVAGPGGTGGAACGEALRIFLKALLRGRDLYAGPVRVAALRIETGGTAGEGAGFALFHGDDGNDYWITMRVDGGEWKVASAAPQALR